MKSRFLPAVPFLLGTVLLTGSGHAAPEVRATLEDSLPTDGAPAGTANEGDVIEYRAVISNSGTTSATDVAFDATLDPKVRQVAGSENISPLALDDSYSAVGNTPLKVGVAAGSGPEVVISGSVFDNDREFLGDAFEFDPTFVPTAANGQVTFNPNGTFTYLPDPGFEGTDTFTYRIRDAAGLTGIATVSIEVETPVWYVDAAAGAGGDGRATSPLNSLAGLNDGSVPDEAGDVIYLYSGATYSGGLTLLNGQRLVGGGAALVVEGHPLIGAGTLPTLSHTATTLTLAQNNTVEGLHLTSSGGHALIGSSFGNLQATLGNLTATGGSALRLVTGNAVLSAGTVSATSVPGGSNGVQLASVAGTVGISGTTTVTSPVAAGVSLTNCSAAITFADVTVNSRGNTGVFIDSCTGTSVTFGAVSIPNPSNSGGYGIRIEDGTAPVTFASTTISSTRQTVAAADGNSDAHPDSDGDGDAIFIKNQSGTVTINGGTLSNLACDGIDIRGSSNLTVSGMTITDIGLGSGNVTTVDSAGIFVRNLSGILSVKDTAIRNFHGALDAGLDSAAQQEKGINMRNHNVSFSQVRLDNVDMENVPGHGLEGADGFEAVFSGAVSGAIKIFNGCSFKHLSDGEGVQIVHTGSGNLDVEIAGSSFSDAVQWDHDSNPSTAKLGGFGGIDFAADGSATCRVHIKDSHFHDLYMGNFTAGIVNLRARGTSACSFLFTGNTMDGDALDNGAGRIGVNMTAGDGGDFGPAHPSPTKFDVLIEDNLIDDTDDDAFTVDIRGGALSNGTVGNVVIRDNTIGSIAAVSRRGRLEGGRIRVRDASAKTVNVLVSGNSIRNHGDSSGDGVLEMTSEAAGCVVNATVINNTFKNDDPSVGAPVFYADTRSGGVMNLELAGNTADAATNVGAVEYHINNGGQIHVKGAGTSTVTAANVQALNPSGGGVAFIGSGTTQFNNNATIPQAVAPTPPALPLMSDPGPAPESVPVQASAPAMDGEPLPDPLPTGRVSDALRQVDLDAAVAEARSRWIATGLTEEQIGLLDAVKVTVADLHGLHLGASRPGIIELDSDAATCGWYLGDTAGGGFSDAGNGRFKAWPGSPAERRMDLLTTVMHELGHQLGLGDIYDRKVRDDLMFGYLVPGERRIPRPGQAGGALPDGGNRDEYLLAPFLIGDLPPGKSVTITFRAEVDLAVGSEISLQGTVSGGNFADLSTDDPDVVGETDATVTPYQGNRSPVVSADAESVSGFIGDTLTNAGAWSDEDAGQTVSLAATSGTVVRNGDGTWSWSLAVSEATVAPVTVTITADDGTGLSNGGSQTSFTYSVARKVQEITFDPPATQSAPVPLVLAATATSGLPVSFSVTDGADIATLGGDGVTLTFSGAGSVTVEASQAGDDEWAAASIVSRTFSVEKAVQSIVFDLATAGSHRTPIALSADGGGSGEPVVFSIQSGPGSIDGNELTFTGIGDVEVVASQAGNELYEAATPVVRTITATNAAPALTLTGHPLELSIEETRTAMAAGTFSDADGDPVTFSPTVGGDPFGSVTVTEGGWEWSYPDATPGDYLVRITATDSLGESAFVEFTLEVTENPYLAWAAENGLTGENAGIDDDFDSDGVVNLLEFAFGTDPTVPSPQMLEAPVVDGSRVLNQRGRPMHEIVATAAAPDMKVLMMRRISHAADGLSYFVEFSWDLSSWETSSAEPQVLLADGDYELVAVPYPFFLSDGRKARFFRVRVEYDVP